MAELPELRTIANINGGSTTMLLSRQHSNSPEAVFVLGSDSFGKEAGSQREAFKASNARGPESQAPSGKGGLDPAVSRAARWASLDSNDRRVFNNWALAVTAFYLSFVILLLVAILLGAYLPADGELFPAAPALERSSSQLSAPATRSIGK
jgi:hypothetical protein